MRYFNFNCFLVLSLIIFFAFKCKANADDVIDGKYPLEVTADILDGNKLDVTIVNRGEYDLLIEGLNQVVQEGLLEDDQFEWGKTWYFLRRKSVIAGGFGENAIAITFHEVDFDKVVLPDKIRLRVRIYDVKNSSLGEWSLVDIRVKIRGE